MQRGNSTGKTLVMLLKGDVIHSCVNKMYDHIQQQQQHHHPFNGPLFTTIYQEQLL